MPSRSDVLSPLTTPAIQKRSGISNTVGSFVSPSTSRHKGMDSPVTMYMEEYDAGTEKRDRRRSRALELKQTVGSPASPAERYFVCFCLHIYLIRVFHLFYTLFGINEYSFN